mgnify:FL=1
MHIYGIHLLNPYKTVVSHHNLFPQWTSTCIYATGILENRVVHEMANSPTENMKVHVKDEENRGSDLERSLEMETARAVNTPHLISNKENYNIRLRDLSSKLDPVFNLMKITGIFHGDNSLNGNRNQHRDSSSFVRFYCVFLTLCQWILVAKTVISLFLEGFSELLNFYTLLV